MNQNMQSLPARGARRRRPAALLLTAVVLLCLLFPGCSRSTVRGTGEKADQQDAPVSFFNTIALKKQEGGADVTGEAQVAGSAGIFYIELDEKQNVTADSALTVHSGEVEVLFTSAGGQESVILKGGEKGGTVTGSTDLTLEPGLSTIQLVSRQAHCDFQVSVNGYSEGAVQYLDYRTREMSDAMQKQHEEYERQRQQSAPLSPSPSGLQPQTGAPADGSAAASQGGISPVPGQSSAPADTGPSDSIKSNDSADPAKRNQDEQEAYDSQRQEFEQQQQTFQDQQQEFHRSWDEMKESFQ